MSQISLGLQLDPENKVQMEACAVFFGKLAGGGVHVIEKTTEKKEEPAPAKKEEPAPAKKEAAPVKEEDTAPVVEEKEATKKVAKKETAAKKQKDPDPAPEAEEEVTESDITADDIRALVAEKVSSHREAIKQKLTKLEANNISALQPEHFEEFMQFLKELK